MKRFLLAICLSSATLASAQDKTRALLPANRSADQAIDHYIDIQLKENKLRPTQPVDDAGFLRRVTLDMIGRIPTLQETVQYTESKSPARKTDLVERLLKSPAFARHQGHEFASFLIENKKASKGALLEYLQEAFAENRPWDQMFREMMLPDDNDPKKKNAGEFLKTRIRDLNKTTIDVSTSFFGVNVSCAQCHDHPHVTAWTQDHFYGMKSFFARTIDVGGFLGEKDFGTVKYVPNQGTEKVAPVLFLTGKTFDVPGLKEPSGEEKKKEQARLDDAKKTKKMPAPPAFSLRAKFVDNALAQDQRHFFARNVINRLWYRLYGHGLVMPLDQMHIENPASHPELLDWLTRDLVEHGYDLRRLVRGIVLSQAYARSSQADSQDRPPPQLFAVAQVRALTPTQLAGSLKVATGDPDQLNNADDLAKSAEKLWALFPQPGERFQVGVSEAMLFNNGVVLKELVQQPESLMKRLLQEKDFQKRAELAVRVVLSRPARQEEVEALVAYQSQRKDRPDAACDQMVWALYTSSEFRFNH